MLRRFKALLDSAAGTLVIGLFRAVGRFDRKRSADFVGTLMRKVGPMFKEHRLAGEQLRVAFPDKSQAEIEAILGGVWDNVGRVAIEFAHLEEFGIKDLPVSYEPETLNRLVSLRESGRASIVFTSHLANWELAGVVAKIAGLKSAVLFRPPNIRALRDAIVKLREPLMGEMVATSLSAPIALARFLQTGTHVGMLADQHYSKGVEVTFFGRPCLANPLVAQLARQTEAPIHGVRFVRGADGNSFWGEFTDAITPARDPGGRINIQGTMQIVTTIIEDWVREHPEQWLWLHRRWR